MLPDDTETGWSQLSPDFQQEVGSYEDYDGFWSTIDAVTVEDVQAAGPGAVDATLVYTTDGSSQSEVRRIELTAERGRLPDQRGRDRRLTGRPSDRTPGRPIGSATPPIARKASP